MQGEGFRPVLRYSDVDAAEGGLLLRAGSNMDAQPGEVRLRVFDHCGALRYRVTMVPWGKGGIGAEFILVEGSFQLAYEAAARAARASQAPGEVKP
jgi:hypothetical protein